MSGFQYHRASDPADALVQAAVPGSAFIAGGTDMLQLWKIGAQTPPLLVDISRLRFDTLVHGADGVTIGALARIGDVAADPAILRDYPLIADAILASASGQIRNMATIGGNLLQRTRCPYFRTADLACNKRDPGLGCGALVGEHRHAAIFGASPACIATHPSDLAVALVALGAQIDILAPAGARRVPIGDFYRLPGDTPERDTNLATGELITGMFVPYAPGRATYLKIRDRASFEFAVISVAARLHIDNGIIVAASLAAGGVAPMPWRLAASEAALVGQPPSAASFAAAAALAVAGAAPRDQNRFKVALLRSAVQRALETTGDQA